MPATPRPAALAPYKARLTHMTWSETRNSSPTIARILSIALLAISPLLIVTPLRSSALSPPTIETPVINVCGSGLTSCAVTVGSGGTSYFFAATIGGAYTISAVDFTPDASVVNGQGLTSVLVGHSTSNTGTFNPNSALFPIIGGIGVSSSSYTTQTFSNSGQTSLSNALVVSQQSLVVVVSASSNNAPFQSLSSTFTVLNYGSSSCCSTVAFAEAQLAAGNYPFTITYAACTSPCTSDPTSMAIGVVFYVFPLTTQGSTTTSVSCSPSTVSVGSTTLCTATVASSLGGIPDGEVVSFSSSSSTGSFSNSQCYLSSGSCSVLYSDATAGNPAINASYAGDANDAMSNGTTTIIVAAELIGIKNTVTLTDFSIASSGELLDCSIRLSDLMASCFSIQQNFFISGPNGIEYWAQNILLVGKDHFGNVMVGSAYNVFKVTLPTLTLVACGGGGLNGIAHGKVGKQGCIVVPESTPAGLPATFYLQSVISGGELQMMSGYSGFPNSYMFKPTSTISSLSEPPAVVSTSQTQLDIVGECCKASVVFQSPTDGQVTSSVMLAGGSLWSSSIIQTPLVCGTPCNSVNSGTPTGETSMNLKWTPELGTNIAILSIPSNTPVDDEGVGFTPG
jgi:hypothetical protein